MATLSEVTSIHEKMIFTESLRHIHFSLKNINVKIFLKKCIKVKKMTFTSIIKVLNYFFPLKLAENQIKLV